MYLASESFIRHYVIKPIIKSRQDSWAGVQDAAFNIAVNLYQRANMLDRSFLRNERVGKDAKARFWRLSLTKTNLAWHAGATVMGALYFNLCEQFDLASIDVTAENIWKAHVIGARLKMLKEKVSFVKDPRELCIAVMSKRDTTLEVKLPSEIFAGPAVDAIEGFSPINGGRSARRQLIETLVAFSVKSSVRGNPSP